MKLSEIRQKIFEAACSAKGEIALDTSGAITIYGRHWSDTMSLYSHFASVITGLSCPTIGEVARALGGDLIENSIYEALSAGEADMRRQARGSSYSDRRFWQRCRLARRLILRDLGLTESKS